MTKTIALISPASPVSPNDVLEGKNFLEARGYDVIESPYLYDVERFLAGDDISRAKEFMWAWCQDGIDLIIAVRGGYGSQRILPYLDWNEIKKHNKLFFGFSDITALQLALLAKSNKPSYSGFVLVGSEGQNRQGLIDIIEDTVKPAKYVGGCLSLVCSLLGSEYLPSFTDSNILLEDVGEKPYRIDRMLSSLDLAGCFDGCNSVTFGSFKDCYSTDTQDGTIGDVLKYWQNKITKPVYLKTTYGHGAGEIIKCQY